MTEIDAPDLRNTQAEFAQAAAPVPGALELDPADYLADMESFDLTDAQKVELLETLWCTLRSLVEMGADIGRADPCGQLFGSASQFPVALADGVDSSASTNTEKPAGKTGREGAS